MKQNKKIILLGTIILLILTAGITYSVFSSSGMIDVADQNIAKFIFDTEPVNTFDILLDGLKPGDKRDIEFVVTNYDDENIAEVSIEYQVILKTYHFMPLSIELYKINEEEDLVLECDESYSRNEQNEIVCNSPIQEMSHEEEKQDEYRLKVNFPEEYNDVSYSELLDFINLEIKSWQKLEG